MASAFEDGQPHDFATADTVFHEAPAEALSRALLREARPEVLGEPDEEN